MMLTGLSPGRVFGSEPAAPAPAAGSPIAPPAPPPERSPRAPAQRSPGFLTGVVFFPPVPPVFRAPIEENVSRREPTAPVEIAVHVGEAFYPALGTRLYRDSLSPRLAARLKTYETHRAAQLNELHDRLLVLQDADPAVREGELRAFAAVQNPRLAALENEAEQLREDLIDGGALKFSVDWNRARPWILGETKFPSEPVEKEGEFQVTRAAAYFQSGLAPAQRGLLRELAIDLDAQARAARGANAPRSSQADVIFFSPETARLHVPPNLPPELAAKLARYNGDKAALKRELGALVREQDRATPNERTAAFTALADAQWPRLVALEELAEEIRRGLAALPPRPLASPPPIPAALLARIEAYNAERRAYLDSINEILHLAAESIPQPRSSGFDTPQDRARQYRAYIAEQLAAQRRALESYQRETTPRFEAIKRQLDSIQADLTALARTMKDPKTGKPFDGESLLRAYRASLQEFDAFGREETIYANYRSAVLSPGLSPEQRRLLFGAAVAGLAQPLPPGEPMPRSPLPQVAR